MSAAHTPGPWCFWTFGADEIETGDGSMGAILMDEGDGAERLDEASSANGGYDIAHVYGPDWEANACLIEAAPDLLDACCAILAWDEAERTAEAFIKDGGAGFYQRIALCQEAFDKARAAVAKAVGGAS